MTDENMVREHMKLPPQEGFLCRAWGETDWPAVEFVLDWDGVRAFLVREWLGADDATDYDGENTLDRFKRDFDEHEEDKRGPVYSIDFEIGGVSVERVTGFVTARPADGVAVPAGFVEWLKTRAADTYSCGLLVADALKKLAATPATLEPRPLTAEEHQVLRAAVLSSGTLVAKGRLVEQPAAVPTVEAGQGEPAVHELKTDWQVFGRVVKGLKLFEIRKDDRGFKVGDVLRLRETGYSGAEMVAGQPLIYTGREYTVRVIDIVRGPIYGLADGWVIMSIAALSSPAPVQQEQKNG